MYRTKRVYDPPSPPLRQWFDHDPAKWNEFQRRYRKELEADSAKLVRLLALVKTGRLATLLYGARDTEHNNAAALLDYLDLR